MDTVIEKFLVPLGAGTLVLVAGVIGAMIFVWIGDWFTIYIGRWEVPSIPDKLKKVLKVIAFVLFLWAIGILAVTK